MERNKDHFAQRKKLNNDISLHNIDTKEKHKEL